MIICKHYTHVSMKIKSTERKYFNFNRCMTNKNLQILCKFTFSYLQKQIVQLSMTIFEIWKYLLLSQNIKYEIVKSSKISLNCIVLHIDY